eukprot:Awhi_evm2s14489
MNAITETPESYSQDKHVCDSHYDCMFDMDFDASLNLGIFEHLDNQPFENPYHENASITLYKNSRSFDKTLQTLYPSLSPPYASNSSINSFDHLLEAPKIPILQDRYLAFNDLPPLSSLSVECLNSTSASASNLIHGPTDEDYYPLNNLSFDMPKPTAVQSLTELFEISLAIDSKFTGQFDDSNGNLYSYSHGCKQLHLFAPPIASSNSTFKPTNSNNGAMLSSNASMSQLAIALQFINDDSIPNASLSQYNIFPQNSCHRSKLLPMSISKLNLVASETATSFSGLNSVHSDVEKESQLMPMKKLVPRA